MVYIKIILYICLYTKHKTIKMENFRYYTYEELLPFLGKELEYMTVCGLRKGLLSKDLNKDVLWLPFLGGVKATTVPVKL